MGAGGVVLSRGTGGRGGGGGELKSNTLSYVMLVTATK